jgi:hypothetical protein
MFNKLSATAHQTRSTMYSVYGCNAASQSTGPTLAASQVLSQHRMLKYTAAT